MRGTSLTGPSVARKLSHMDPYNTAPAPRDPWKGEPVGNDRSKSK
jgi:hypothetical protein